MPQFDERPLLSSEDLDVWEAFVALMGGGSEGLRLADIREAAQMWGFGAPEEELAFVRLVMAMATEFRTRDDD